MVLSSAGTPCASSSLESDRGGNDGRDQAIGEGHRDIRGWHQGEDPQENEDWHACCCVPGDEQRAGENKSGEDDDRREVALERMGAARASDADPQRDAIPQPLFEGPPATGHEVVPRVLLGAAGNGEEAWLVRSVGLHAGGTGWRRGSRVLLRCVTGQPHCFACHLQLR